MARIVDIEPFEAKYKDLYNRAARSGKRGLAELLRIILHDVDKLETKDFYVIGTDLCNGDSCTIDFGGTNNADA